MSEDAYLKERAILIDIYGAQVRAHSQNSLAIAVSAFSAIVVWVQIRSVEIQFGRGLIPGFNLATPFLLASLSVLALLTLYMVGRALYWSHMIHAVMRVESSSRSSDTAEKKRTYLTLGSLEDLSTIQVKLNHWVIYLFFKPHGAWKLLSLIGFAAILFLVGLMLSSYHSEWCAWYFVLIPVAIVFELAYWVRHYQKIFN